VTGAAENVLDLVADEVFDGLAGGAHIFTRIEFTGLFREYFSNAGGHGHAQVGVDVDLGATDAAGDFDVGFGNALGIRHFTTILVDLRDEVLGDAGRTVQHEGIVAEVGIEEGLLDEL